VTFTASGTDPEQGVLPAVCVPASGAIFPVGATTVDCTVTDDGGLTAGGSFIVTVTLAGATKNSAPTVTAPDTIVAAASDAAGTAVSFAATATDPEDGPLGVVCTPPSGSVFPLGKTVVTCSATDSGGLTASTLIRVSVHLNEAPKILGLADSGITVAATSPAGAVVSYAATGMDQEDGTVAVACVPPSGSTFPIGSTWVACSATDSHGATTTVTFRVKVTNVAPTLTVPPSVDAPAQDASGAAVDYVVSAHDLEDGPLTPACTPASGALFPIGETTVECSVTDRAGATTTGSFTVKVR